MWFGARGEISYIIGILLQDPLASTGSGVAGELATNLSNSVNN